MISPSPRPSFAFVVWTLLSLWFAGAVQAQVVVAASAPLADDDARQVTLFGVIASPGGSTVDPKLAAIAPQLRKLLPNHSFRLLGAQTRRLAAGETLTCPLGDGYTATTTLTSPLDDNGKVQLRCAVMFQGAAQLQSQVNTPPNQLFFCDKHLPDGGRLLVGIGAR